MTRKVNNNLPFNTLWTNYLSVEKFSCMVFTGCMRRAAGKKVAAHYLHYVNETLINVQMTKKAWENQSACGLLDVRCRLFKKNRYFGFA